MATDMKIWKKRVMDELRAIADDKFQRAVWFGGEGTWVDSPSERICKFDDLLIPSILGHADNELRQDQAFELAKLSQMMDHLVECTPDSIRPEDLIDDPRWIAIRRQAAITFRTLAEKDGLVLK